MSESDSEENQNVFSIDVIYEQNPFWIAPNGIVVVECLNPLYKESIDMIKKVSKVICQMKSIEEYHITEYTLYSSLSMGITKEQLFTHLQKYCKNQIPDTILDMMNMVFDGRILTITCDYERRRYCSGNPYVLDEIETELRDGKRYVKNDIVELKYECKHKRILLIEEVEYGKNCLPIALRNEEVLRYYQVAALNSVFSPTVARCGMIVLPCGSGKTLLSIALICTMKQRSVIICTSIASIEQWRDEIRKWSTIPFNKIKCFSSVSREPLEESYVVITTYQMMQSKAIMDLEKEEFGLMILDEAHASVADEFKKVYSTIKCRCRIGLTASPVREDSKLAELDYLTGPILYQQSWMKLIEDHYIAQIHCFDIQCRMTSLFYQEYLRDPCYRHKVVLSSLNPTKIGVVQFLVSYHSRRKEQIIIFCDSIVVLRELAFQVRCPVYCGETPLKDRENILKKFRLGELICVAMSCIGDTSLDIPDATVVIQVSTNNGSRRQQLQRLGRISRRKHDDSQGYFYSLTSTDTHEEQFVHKRQAYLQNLGFTFKIVSDMKVNIISEDEQGKIIQRSIREADRRYFLNKNRNYVIEDEED